MKNVYFSQSDSNSKVFRLVNFWVQLGCMRDFSEHPGRD